MSQQKLRSELFIIAVYYISALAISMVLLIPYLVIMNKASEGPGTALLMIAAAGASLSALITAIIFYGLSGLKNLLKGVIKLKIKWYWYIIALFLMPAILLIASWLSSFLNLGIPFQNPISKLSSVVPVFIIITIQAGIGEEIGWRGFMTPHLNRKMPLLYAAVITGISWSLWHSPLFFIKGMFQYEITAQIGFVPGMIWYMFFLTASSIIYSFAVSASGGSIFLACLFHGSLNAATWLINANDVSKGTNGLRLLTIVTCATAIALVLITRKHNAWKRIKKAPHSTSADERV